MQFNHPLSQDLVASGKQLHSYSGNTLSPLNDYRLIKKGLLVCHKCSWGILRDIQNLSFVHEEINFNCVAKIF